MESQDLGSQRENNKSPFVAVWMVTYNHETYIAQAIESILMQQTNFDFKLYIGEDCSTDNTRKVLLTYKEKYPDQIELILHEKNIGANANGIFMYEYCFKSGAKYIALCEGDDYWTDPLKLQKQVGFLEENQGYVLSFHTINILKPDGSIVEDFITQVPENHETIEDLARLGNYIHTPSVVFRNVLPKLPFELQLSPLGDYFVYMMLAEYGKLKYVKDTMAIYRHGVGMLSGNNNVLKLKKWIDSLLLIFSVCKNEAIKRIIYERYDSAIQDMYRMTFKNTQISNFSIFKNKLKRLKNKISKRK